MFDLNQFAKEVHENAVAHGFWEGAPNIPEKMALIHSEWSEALEEYRAGHEAVYEGEGGKPEGWAVELIDGCIRILDYIGYGYPNEYFLIDDGVHAEDDLSEQNISDLVFFLHRFTTESCNVSLHNNAEWSLEVDGVKLFAVAVAVLAYVESINIDPEALLRKKHEYNQTRPYKHGKKF